jgi:hypothetical protein
VGEELAEGGDVVGFDQPVRPMSVDPMITTR